MVREVGSLEEFQSILKEAGDKLVVVDFTAAWCGPCIMISPYFDKFSKDPENSNVIFLKVDVDEAEDVSQFCQVSCMPTFMFYKNGTMDVSQFCQVSCMPTFMFYKNGTMVDSFSGTSKDTLLEKLSALRT